MQNPFPGMNPYLESAGLWPQFHNRLIVAIADEITPQIAPKYRVSIEERVYTSVDDALLVGIADVAVLQRQSSESNRVSQTVAAVEPLKVQVPIPAETTERFLEIRRTQADTVVCVIEVLSPKNKQSKEGRTAYETKRQKILGSATHLVEIDLLRSGEAMPILGIALSGYRILVSRSDRRPEADLYPFGLPDPIPAFPVPLQPGDRDPVLDLQHLVNDIYTRARFDLAIDYSQPLRPGASDAEAAWIAAQLDH